MTSFLCKKALEQSISMNSFLAVRWLESKWMLEVFHLCPQSNNPAHAKNRKGTQKVSILCFTLISVGNSSIVRARWFAWISTHVKRFVALRSVLWLREKRSFWKTWIIASISIDETMNRVDICKLWHGLPCGYHEKGPRSEIDQHSHFKTRFSSHLGAKHADSTLPVNLSWFV
jgi:hypothetical protein